MSRKVNIRLDYDHAIFLLECLKQASGTDVYQLNLIQLLIAEAMANFMKGSVCGTSRKSY